MKYTEEVNKAIKNAKEFANTKYGILSALEVKILLNLIEKQNKEIARLDGQNVVINYMRSGKNLLSRIATDYAESTLRVFELQSVSGYTIDFIIDLFKRGFVLVDEEDYISKEKIREKIKELKDNRPYLSKFDDWKEKEYTNEDINNMCVEVLEDLLGDE